MSLAYLTASSPVSLQAGAYNFDNLHVSRYQVLLRFHHLSELRFCFVPDFWVKNNPDEASLLISSDEYKELDERKISSDDIESYKLDRVPSHYLEEYSYIQ